MHHDIVKYLQENIHVCMENHLNKKRLLAKIQDTNDAFKQLERLGRDIQKAVVI